MSEVIGVGLLGCGIVGAAVTRILHENAEQIRERIGANLEVRKVAVRNLSKTRDVPVSADLFTDDPSQVVSDPEIDILVEVMGGIEPARTLVFEAMRSNKHVVSANKELISTLGKELLHEAEVCGVDLYFEGAVAGGIPIIRPLKESLSAERIFRVMGIVNGTTNYILTRMSEDGMEFAQALTEAEQEGYAELDPTADIEGFDAAAKLSILASLAFNQRVVAGDVYREGIAHVSAQDIRFAKTLGYTVKLLAIGELVEGQVAVRVHPAMIPDVHPLASVRDNLNAVFVEGEQVGELMFLGRGAGGPTTATAVVGDIVDVARNMRAGGIGPVSTCYSSDADIRPMDLVAGQYYLLLEVHDRPGVLAKVAQVFADNKVSIKSVWQEGLGDDARLVLVTHKSLERDFQSLLGALQQLDVVEKVTSTMRVQSEE